MALPRARASAKGWLLVVPLASCAALGGCAGAASPPSETATEETTPSPSVARPFCTETEPVRERLSLSVARARFDVRVLHGDLSVTDEELARFLEESARAVAMLLGRFPEPRVEVTIDPVGPGDDPVAFGLVRKTRGPCVLLLVRESATLDALLGDWTTVHELTHLVFPRLRDEDAWLAEGLATYYQEVLRARASLQSEREAWRRLERGFGLGREDGTDRTLAEESRSMRRTFAFRRVYWSGAAWALELDVRLREAGRGSLDAAVVAARAGFPHGERWSGRRLARALDEAVGATLAVPLFDAYAARRDFPETAPILERLGVVRGRDGALALADDAPLSAVRRAITAPAPAGGDTP